MAGFTSDYADGKLSKHGGGTARAMKKEGKYRTKATKATLYGKTKKAAKYSGKAMKQRSKMTYPSGT